MNPLAEPLARSPELFPHSLDVRTDSVGLIRLTETDYTKASFLDARILAPGTLARPVAFAVLAGAAAEGHLQDNAHFIFHIGHVGSTLLSRLLGRHPALFSLREPAILRTLAQMRSEPETMPRRWSAEEFDARFSTFLKLWSRTFRPDQHALVKATSFASELAAEILNRSSERRAIFMFVSPENYLATILGAENSPKEAQILANLRHKRLQSRLGAAVQTPASMGELVAMSWASEMTALAAAQASSAAQILWLDFDRFLAEPSGALKACFAHLGVAPDDAQIRDILSGPDMRTYSKAQEYDYDAKLRTDVLAQARAMQGAEIARGMNWLGNMAAKHPALTAATNIARAS
jgi:hypothetical protein